LSYPGGKLSAMTDELLARHDRLLTATPPFSLDASLRALSGFAPCAGDQLVAGGRVRKAFPRPGIPDEAVVVEVAPCEDAVCGVFLSVNARSPLSPGEIDDVERTVRDWLSLDDDLSGFLAVARGDPAMARVLTAVEGLHQVRFASLAEGATYFTLTQRSTQWFAAARKRRIAATLGPRAVLDGVAYVAFPTLDTLRALDAAPPDRDIAGHALVGYAGNRQRADRLRQVLDGVAALDEEWLRTAPYADARRALLAIPGVGPFTAHAILLRVLGRPDDVPLEMAQFTRVAEALYGDPAPTADALRERYGRWIGWWAYLARMGLGWLGQPDSQPDSESSQRSRVRTPHPVAPLASTPSAESDQAGADMSRWAHRSLASPVNSRRKRAAISDPPPTSVALTRSATSLPSAST
jgi:DNA-3-methyladenine glycosylase II